jgi:transcriptional regulatory protein AMDR
MTSVPALTSNALSSRKQSENGSNLELVEFVDQKELSTRSILRGVRISYVGKDVSNMNFLVRQRDVGEDEAEHHFATNDIAGQFIIHEPDRIPREAFILPERELADQLVQAYFTHVNPGCPLVDEDIFMEQYRKTPTEPISLLVLQAILLVGAHVSRDRPDRDTLKATFFRRAKMLYDARLEKNRDFIIQAALLLTWHSDGPDDTEANAWFWVGIAARTAMGLGLHRDRSASKIVHIDGRTWERLWWILVQFDVLVSLFYGRPQAM